MPTAKELREEFSTVHAAATKVVDDAIAAGTELTAEAKAENDKRFARLEVIKKTLDEQAKFAGIALAAGTVVQPTQSPAELAFNAASNPQEPGKIDRMAFAKAAAIWAATGIMAAQFATITTASQSGILLPVGVMAPMTPGAINSFRLAYNIWGVQVTTTPGTGKFNVPVLSAVAGGAVTETDSSENDNPPGLTESIVSTPATYESGSAYFSNLALAANDFDIVPFVEGDLVNSKELGLESAIAAAIIADAGITQSVTTDSPTAFTIANLAALDNALPKRFQQQKVILLSATAFAAADALCYASGPKVLTIDANGLRRFNGTPVLRCDYFETLAASHKIGIVYSLMGFHLRDAGPASVTRYTQVPAKPNQTGFNLFTYHAWGYCPSAVAKFLTPAS